MAATHRSWYNLVVWTPIGIHIEAVHNFGAIQNWRDSTCMLPLHPLGHSVQKL